MGKKREPSALTNDPEFFKALHERAKAGWEPEFLAGDHNALFYQIEECADRGLPLPEWAAKAFLAGMWRIDESEFDTLDDAFGWKKQPGQRPARRLFQQFGRLVFARCIDLRAAKERGDRPANGLDIAGISQKFFDSVSESLAIDGIGVSGRTVQAYYYRVLAENWGDDLAAAMEREKLFHSNGLSMFRATLLSDKL